VRGNHVGNERALSRSPTPKVDLETSASARDPSK